MQYASLKRMCAFLSLIFILFPFAYSQSGRSYNKNVDGNSGRATQPFHVVLMLDTTAVKLMFGTGTNVHTQFREASFAFIEQLQEKDRVKIMSFDKETHTVSDFTNDKDELKKAVAPLQPGTGKKLYDAMDRAIADLEKVKDRKAIIIFTDGVDWQSNSSHKKNLDRLEKAGITVYPVSYDTRQGLERMVRIQQQYGVADLDAILGEGNSVTKTVQTGPVSGGIRIHRPSIPKQPPIDGPKRPTRTGSNGNIEAEIDRLYSIAGSYLKDLADTTGGRLYNADTVTDLPTALVKIADELRTQ